MSEPHTSSTSPGDTSTATPTFECVRVAGLGGVTLEVRGRLDAEGADRLQEILRDALTHARLVVLDLEAVSLIDAFGVLVIAQANRAAQTEGRRLVVVRPPTDVHEALALDGTGGGLTVVDTGAAARAGVPSAGSLQVDVRSSSGAGLPYLLVACLGEIDMATAPQLREAIAGLDPGDVLVDLSGISFMDSTGLSTLLDAQRRLVRQGHRLVVVCPAGTVRNVFRLTALLETLNVVDDRAAGERVLAP